MPIHYFGTRQSEINLPFVTADSSGPKHLVMTLTKASLENLVGDLVQKTMDPCQKAISDSGISAKDIDEVILVGGMTRMPAVQDAVLDLFKKEPHQGVNPDEVVAVGAALQAGVLQGEVQDLLLLDVTPLTLGIETMGGVTTALIPRNTTIPTAKSEIFTTAADGQTSVEVHVLQGERPMAAENKTIGRFMLDGILSAPRGTPQVEVTFDLDANGILNVSAKDKGTGKEQKITITASSGLDESEIEQMVKEAEEHAEEDDQRRKNVELRNEAENTAYSAEKMIKDNPEIITDEQKTRVEDSVKAVRDAIEKEDSGQINVSLTELQSIIQEVGQAVYASQASQDPGAEGSKDQSSGDDDSDDGSKKDTIEGDFKEV